jgi:hypothetical protein
MKALWTWGGTFFGYREADELWTYDGRHVEHFYGEEVYGSDGQYLGEIISDNRLITCLSKKSWRRGGFSPYANRVGFVPYVDYVGKAMYVGYEDFPASACFRQRS